MIYTLLGLSFLIIVYIQRENLYVNIAHESQISFLKSLKRRLSIIHMSTQTTIAHYSEQALSRFTSTSSLHKLASRSVSIGISKQCKTKQSNPTNLTIILLICSRDKFLEIDACTLPRALTKTCYVQTKEKSKHQPPH